MRLERLAISITVSILATGCLARLATDHYALGQQAAQRKQYQQCYHELEQVPREHENYQVARFIMGECQWLLGERERGVALMLEARKLDAAAFDASHLPGELAHAVGELSSLWSLKLPDRPVEIYPAGAVVLAVLDQGDMVAVSVDKRSVLWRIALGNRLDYGEVRPAIADGTVFAVQLGKSERSSLVALDLATGAKRWELALDHSGHRATPAIAGDVVHVAGKDAVLALDRATGTERWKQAVDGTPGNIVFTGKHVCALAHTGRISCLAPDTGSVEWTYDAGDSAKRSMLLGVGDALYYTNNTTITALTVGRTELRWQKTLDDAISDPVSIQGGAAIAVKAQHAILALAADTGEPVWTATLPQVARGGDVTIPPVARGDGYLAASANRGLVVLAPDTGAFVSFAAVEGQPSSAPATAGGTVFVGTGDKLFALAPRPW